MTKVTAMPASHRPIAARRRALLRVPLALGLWAALTAAAAAEPFTVAEVDVEDRKAVFATVETVDVTAARTRIGGTVDKLSVDEGSQVTAGQVVAHVADPKLRLRRKSVEARIQALESQKKLAETALARVRKLHASGTVAKARLDVAETDLEVVTRDLAAVAAERQVVVQQQAEGAVVAPAAGRVLKVHLTKGAVVLPGETVATITAKGFVLRMYLPERHARFLNTGDEVLVGTPGLTADGGASETRTGRVRQVYPEMAQGRVVADVDVDGLGDFFVGERVPVYVATGRRTTMVVPETYLFRRYGLTYVRLDDGAEVVVQPGQPAPGGVEILSGLRPGDVLVPPPAP